ncbi:GNAT family N-acetyltransferase [Robertkochia marina]|uniref:GNAT family N-acetyltransferase n=3 Tax=Robertkochia marina TaxID=1227945 RepID=A0A4S3LXP4_9FLAO|nr:GNAT family N-acetyltransferase [Robertkochia marina]THD66328.1 GNAT family N-acetyltransferase [Robertkochia marina]
MKVITETDRLYLRAFILDDSEHFFKMNADEAVVRYTGDLPFKDEEEALHFLSGYKEYDKYGIGRWAVIRKEDEAFLGWCGLKFHPEESITEVGFRFYQEYWGEGYATEAAAAAVRFGFTDKKFVQIHAHAHRNNKASIRVLEKLGMQPVKDFDYDGLPATLFVLHNPDYALKPISSGSVLQVRHPVLRAGRPEADAVFEGDDDPDTFHLGMFFKDALTGVVTLMKRPPARPSLMETDYQLRGMAVLDGFRRSGIGKALVTEAEDMVSEKGGKGIWMNAREAAAHFYETLGYRITGNLFEIRNVGPHYFMEKSLQKK